MKLIFLSIIILLASCTIPEEKQLEQELVADTATVIETDNSYMAARDTAVVRPIPVPKKVKSPSGTYQVTLPKEEEGLEQTISFHPDHSFQLQERYRDEKKDSVVLTTGTWSPSDGYIWLYKDQVVRGRYIWKGDVLHWMSPRLNKVFPMNPLIDAMENKTWKNKKEEGIVFFGIGNEPFWSIELTKQDSLSFRLADWTKPVTLRIDSVHADKEARVWMAHLDTVQVKLTVWPQFCSDGMSDYVYPNRIRVQYNQQVFNGCGLLYK